MKRRSTKLLAARIRRNSFAMKKPRKKTVIILCALAAVAGAAVFSLRGRGETALPVSAMPLARTELSNRVSATGTIESASFMDVYSTSGSTIREVYVQVGDRVKAGDLLMELDTERLELDIEERTAAIGKQRAAAQLSLSSSERRLEQAQGDLKSERTAGIVNAENALKLAKLQMENANDAYSRAKKQYDEQRDDDEDHGWWDEDDFTYGASGMTLSQLREARDNALSAYNTARLNYRSALDQVDLAGTEAERSLESLEDSVRQGQLEANLYADEVALKKLQLELEEATVTAPVSGTVTAVYAKEGAAGNGLMFVIEDTENLIVKTSLKEYDIGSVKEGMPAVIKSDATGEEEFAGRVSKIYPTARKGENGHTASGSIEFPTDVSLSSKGNGLRIGMNVRLNIITESKQNVWAIPYDAVTTDAAGRQVVYLLRTDDEGRQTASAVEVTTGMETDFYIEITSDELQEGDQIISTPGVVSDGMPVSVLSSGGMAELGEALAVQAQPQESSEEDSSASDSQPEQEGADASEDSGNASGQSEG